MQQGQEGAAGLREAARDHESRSIEAVSRAIAPLSVVCVAAGLQACASSSPSGLLLPERTDNHTLTPMALVCLVVESQCRPPSPEYPLYPPWAARRVGQLEVPTWLGLVTAHFDWSDVSQRGAAKKGLPQTSTSWPRPPVLNEALGGKSAPGAASRAGVPGTGQALHSLRVSLCSEAGSREGREREQGAGESGDQDVLLVVKMTCAHLSCDSHGHTAGPPAPVSLKVQQLGGGLLLVKYPGA